MYFLNYIYHYTMFYNIDKEAGDSIRKKRSGRRLLTMTQTSIDQEHMIANDVNHPIISSVQEQIDVMKHLSQPEVQEALIILGNNLPKLSEMVIVLLKAYDMAQSLLTDELLKKDTVGAMKQFTEPIKATVKDLTATAIEAKDRAEANISTSIGLFGLLRMLKDPQVQKIFRFVQAYINITNEKQK